MKNILITGANGFVGQHLAKELHDSNYGVVGIGGPQGNTEPSPYLSSYQQVDLNDKTAVEGIDFKNIDGIIHLAGLAAVGPSFDDPMSYINTNMGIEINLFETVLKQDAKPRFVVISTGALYDASSPLPLTENSAVVPSSPYAVSKLGQEQLAQYYARRGLECIIARPFNHFGPGQGPGFIVPDLAQQIVKLPTDGTGIVTVGNLDAERDYTDVRDIARAYRLLFESGAPGETYNICSGTPRSGHTVLSTLLNASGVTANIESDPSKMRPADNPVIYGDYKKISADTSWEPSISFEDTMADVVADFRTRT